MQCSADAAFLTDVSSASTIGRCVIDRRDTVATFYAKWSGDPTVNKPNLLLIMCDQLRADALGCYGNVSVKTPNIDRLAKRGVTFNRAYSQTPVCMPARHGLLSGLHPFQLGLLENGTMTQDIAHPLPALIRSRGYATFAVGKMHFDPVREHYGFDRMLLSEEIPEHIQDDDFLQFLQSSGFGHVAEPHGKRSENYYVPQVSPLPEELHTTAWTAAQTCDIIRKNRNRPFFIFTSFIKPHPPFDPCPPYNSMYQADQLPSPVRAERERQPDDYLIRVQNDYKVNGIDNLTPEWEAKIREAYYGCVTQIDTQVGTILDTLRDCQLQDNTLIVFTSDHGELLGDHYAYGKRSFYEASTRIPLIISHPASLPMGESLDQLAILQDVYGTLLTGAGTSIPAGSCARDLLSSANDSGVSGREEVCGEIGRGPAMKMMLRWGDFKYIYHVNGGVDTLFDLEKDPNELHNVAEDQPDLCAYARDRLLRYYQKTGLEDALDGDALLRIPQVTPSPTGYLDQRPRWPQTVI